MEYLNFDIFFERFRKKYKARVISPPIGQAEIAFRNPFSAMELENFFLKIGMPQRSRLHSFPSDTEITKQFGGQLFETIFDKAVGECLQSSLEEAKNQGKGLRLRFCLTSTPELVSLPWEYLYDANTNRFLSLSIETPIVRYLGLEEQARKLSVKPPLRILVIISSPSNYPDLNADLEWRKLKKALSSIEQRKLVAAERLEKPTLSSLNLHLRREKYHIIHFVGYGKWDNNLQDGLLILEDEEGHSHSISSEEMGILLKDHHTLGLIFLNTCEETPTSINNPSARTAQGLVQQGIPAVIAMQFEILDNAAITLTKDFYTTLSEGYPLDTALTEARKSIYFNGNKIEWGNPVLYMGSSDGQIFEFEQITEQQESAMSGMTQTEIIPEKRIRPLQTFVDESIEDVGSDSSSNLKGPGQKRIKSRNIRIFLIPIIILFFISLSTIIFLHNIKVSSTLVELQLPVSEFSFELTDKWDVYSLDINSINILNPNNLEMEVLSVEQVSDYNPKTDKPTVWRELGIGNQLIVKRAINSWEVTIESNYLNLTNLFVEAGSQIRISKINQSPYEVNININEGSVLGSLDTGDTILLACSNCEVENGLKNANHSNKKLKIATFDNQIAFKNSGQSLQLELDLRKGASNAQPVLLGQYIPIHSIEFVVQIVEKLNSTIMEEGILSLLEVDNKKLQINEGDFLILEGLEKFQIKKLQIDEQITVTLDGRVSEIKAGGDKNIRSLMPSIFERFFANNSLTMIILAILQLLLSVLAVFYSLKFSQ